MAQGEQWRLLIASAAFDRPLAEARNPLDGLTTVLAVQVWTLFSGPPCTSMASGGDKMKALSVFGLGGVEPRRCAIVRSLELGTRVDRPGVPGEGEDCI